MKQKITIKVDMNCEKCRVKTMQIAATAPGVLSVSMKDDMVTVEGNDVDSVALAGKLRKKVGSARLIGVEEIKEKKKEDAGGKDKKEGGGGGGDKKPAGNTPQAGVITTTAYHQHPYAAFPPPAAYYYGGCYIPVEGVPVSDYDNSSCSIM